MTVEELIEKLRECPQKVKVSILSADHMLESKDRLFVGVQITKDIVPYQVLISANTWEVRWHNGKEDDTR